MSKISMRHLVAVRAVADSQSFTGAAVRLHTTQSNVSIAIREIEEILGARLFDRTTKRFGLTSAGEEFVAVVERLLDDLEAGIENARASSRLQKGVLALGATPLLTSALLADLIAEYRQRHPNVDIRIHDTSSAECLRLLRSRTVEVVMGTFDESEADLFVEPFLQDPLVALVHPSIKLSGRCSWKQLLAHPIVSISRTNVVGQLIDRTFWELTGEPFRPTMEVQYWTTATAFAQRLAGVCIVPAYGAEAMRGELRRVSLNGPRVVRAISVAHLAGRDLSPAARSFVGLAMERKLPAVPTRSAGGANTRLRTARGAATRRG